MFEKQYLSAVPYFRIYIISFIVGAMGAGTVLKATGYTKYTLKAYIFSLVIYLPFSYFSIKYFKTWGAISTAMVGIVLPKIFQIYFEKEILKCKFIEYISWDKVYKILLSSTCIIIPIVIIKQFFMVNIWGAMILSILYIISVYAVEIKQGLFIIDKDFFIHSLKIKRIFNGEN